MATSGLQNSTAQGRAPAPATRTCTRSGRSAKPELIVSSKPRRRSFARCPLCRSPLQRPPPRVSHCRWAADGSPSRAPLASLWWAAHVGCRRAAKGRAHHGPRCPMQPHLARAEHPPSSLLPHAAPRRIGLSRTWRCAAARGRLRGPSRHAGPPAGRPMPGRPMGARGGTPGTCCAS